MSKHTPGPWIAHVSMVDPESGNEVMLIRSENPLRGIVHFELEGRPEDEANARLIAAAPELLERSRSLVAFAKLQHSIVEQFIKSTGGPPLNVPSTGPKDIFEMEKAIAKAEGRNE